MRNSNPLSALLAGVIAFVVTYVVLLILAAVFDAVALGQVANVIERFTWLISLLVGLVVGWQRWNGRTF